MWVRIVTDLCGFSTNISKMEDSSDGWSVVRSRERASKQREAACKTSVRSNATEHDPNQIEDIHTQSSFRWTESAGHESDHLIGSFIYQDHAWRAPTDTVQPHTHGDRTLNSLSAKTTPTNGTVGGLIDGTAHSDLIGAPIVIATNENAPLPAGSGTRGADGLSTVGGPKRGGLLRLPPGMVDPTVTSKDKYPDLSSVSEWPSIATTSQEQATNETASSQLWSVVLKTLPPAPPPKKVLSVKAEEPRGDSDSNSEKEISRRKIKKKKKKKGSVHQTACETQPLMLDFATLFETLQVQPSSKKVALVSTGPGAAVSRNTSTLKQPNLDTGNDKTSPRSGNILDSSAPQMRRGKEREQPKKRKPTPLRKVINKEKEERKKEREGEPIEPIGEAIKKEDEVEPIVEVVSSKEISKKETKVIATNTEAINNELKEDSQCCLEAMPYKCDLEVSKVESDSEVIKVENVVPSGKNMHIDVSTTCDGNIAESVNQLSKPPNKSPLCKSEPTIHNRRFREYCNHIVTDDINECAELLLSDLIRFQDRQFLKDPIKAKIRKRYVCGMREVLKHLKSKRIRCLIVAPNMDRIQSEGGICDVVDQIMSLANEQGLPMVFALSRRRLAFVLKKNHKVGCVGIFSYDGTENHYKRLMELVEGARQDYLKRSVALQLETSHGAPSSSTAVETSHGAPSPSTAVETSHGAPSSSTAVEGVKSQTSEPDVLTGPHSELTCSDGRQLPGNGTSVDRHGNGTSVDSSGNGTSVDCSGNGTSVDRHESCVDLRTTPWSIFFKNQTFSNSLENSDTARPPIMGASCPQGNSPCDRPVAMPTKSNQTLLGNSCHEFGLTGVSGVDAIDKLTQLNVSATEFLPSCRRLNIHAKEFSLYAVQNNY